ncbi:MAG: TetR/AcrR family transcriptional regulator [Spirochaetaceae bacterium]|nr:MAG: TetR/AcrR family transcriptional regulator [Spirochaetaceae bacterium]
MVPLLMAREPRVPQQDRSARTREKISVAARDCFARAGYDRTQAKDIASTAGVSVGTFYEYFPDKAAAFQTVLDDFSAAFESLDVEGYLEIESGVDGFAALLSALQEWVRDFGRLFRDFYTLSVRDPSFEGPLAVLEARIESRFETALRNTTFRTHPTRAVTAAQLAYTVTEAVLFRVADEPDQTTATSLLHETAVCLDAYMQARSQ